MLRDTTALTNGNQPEGDTGAIASPFHCYRTLMPVNFVLPRGREKGDGFRWTPGVFERWPSDAAT